VQEGEGRRRCRDITGVPAAGAERPGFLVAGENFEFVGNTHVMSVKETPVRSIAGRYSLIEELGRGGVGQVWRARDELLRRDVAVKEVVFPGSISELDRASMQARVLREARAAAGLPHSSVVTVYDVIRDDTRGYIVMELIDACSITELVQRDGPLSVNKVAKIARQMVEVLEVAHDHGIIHRDVKPGNVMVLSDGAVKLADFGIAWIKDDPKITASGLILGSPSFMAPEQAQGAEITPATDMWGLGATMYYAVEGELPFDKGQTMATLTSVMVDPPRRPRRAGALTPVIRALLAKDPVSRPSASQVKTLLEPLVFDEPVRTGRRAGPPIAAPLSEWETEADPRVRASQDPQRRSPGTAVAAAAAGEANVGGAGAPPAGVPQKVHAEMAMGWGQDDRSGSMVARVLGVALVAVLAAAAIFFLSHLSNGSQTNRQNNAVTGRSAHHNKRSHSQGSSAAGIASPGASAPAAASSPGATGGSTTASGGSTTGAASSVGAIGATEGWIPYNNTGVGWSIAYPPGWQPQNRDSHDLDFDDPSGGRYLRVAWTTTPGPDPAARWREYSKSFGARYPNYRTIGISPNFSFKGWKASAWEYTYSSGGTLLHAVDLALVNGTYGFALNFQTHDSDWASSQSIFKAFKQSFIPPS
jgi:serine/threonine protein kinase